MSDRRIGSMVARDELEKRHSKETMAYPSWWSFTHGSIYFFACLLAFSQMDNESLIMLSMVASIAVITSLISYFLIKRFGPSGRSSQ